MMSSSTVVSFRRRTPAQSAFPRGLMEAVYSAGSVAISVDEREARAAAAMLATFRFLIIDEVQPDGTLLRLAPSQIRRGVERPWRVSRPAFGNQPVGEPEAVSTAASVQER